MKSADYAGALEWLGRAERLKPDARSELLMAISYQHLKQMDQANRYLELAKRHAPENPDVQRSMAGITARLGTIQQRLQRSSRFATRSRMLRPSLRTPISSTASWMIQPGSMRKPPTLSPKDLGLQLSAAQAEVAAGAIEKANPFLSAPAAIDANYYRLHAIRGEIAKLEERDQDAVREYSAAVAHLPARPLKGRSMASSCTWI
jgi:predicted Zn-dependent protease